MRRVSSVLLLALGAGGAAARGEEIITEEEFLRALVEEHPAVIAQTGRLAEAVATRRGAEILSNPQLAFTAEQPEETPREAIWSLAWAPPLDGRRGLSIRAAEAGVAAAQSALESEQFAFRLQMREVFVAWAIAREKRELLAAHVGRLEALAQRMKARAESGEEPGLSARRVKLEAGEAGALLAAAEAEISRARSDVLVWKPDIGPKRPARPELPVPPAALSVARRRDLEAHRFEVEQSRFEEQLSGRFIRFPGIVVGWKTMRDGDIELEGPVFGFAWSVPLSDRRQAERLGAVQMHRVAEARLTFATQQAEAKLAAAEPAYRRLRTAALKMREGVEGLDQMVEGALTAYEFGESGITDLLDTLRSVIATELAELELLAAALKAHRDLEAAAGHPLPGGASQ